MDNYALFLFREVKLSNRITFKIKYPINNQVGTIIYKL